MPEADTTTTTTDDTKGGGDETQGTTFTQADVDRIIKDRLTQQARTKFGDYDELKTKAEGAKTLEERLANVEGELTKAQQTALRSSIAAEHGISTKKGPKGEPSDADLFLTGIDEATLTAQAQRLVGREADRKKNGNVAPKEGETKSSGDSKNDIREFTRQLFGDAE